MICILPTAAGRKGMATATRISPLSAIRWTTEFIQDTKLLHSGKIIVARCHTIADNCMSQGMFDMLRDDLQCQTSPKPLFRPAALSACRRSYCRCCS